MKLKIGLLGTGGIATDQHAPALAALEDGMLWSVLSRSRDRALAFAHLHGAQAPRPAHIDLAEMLADPQLDAVLITTPDRFHATQAIQAMRAGKHVLVEKPMATSVGEAQAMIDIARKTGRCLAIGYHLRWHAGHRALQRRVVEGQLGAVRHMRVLWTFKAADLNWRARPETGHWWSLAANGTHCIDLARWIMMPGCGEVIHTWIHTSRSVWDTPHDETAIVTLGFESGATAEICVSVLFDSKPRLEIYGSDGNAVCDGTLGRHGAGAIEFGGKPLEFSVSNPFWGEIRDFIRAIRTTTSAEVDGHEGLENIRILAKARQRDATRA